MASLRFILGALEMKHPANSSSSFKSSFPAPARRRAVRAVIQSLEERRLLSAGELDPSFGAGGRVTTDLGGGTFDQAVQVAAVNAGGKLIVAGAVWGQGWAVVRYNADGTVDGTFGTGGQARANEATASVEITSAAVAPNGKVLLCGSLYGSDTGYDFAAIRLNADGTPDTTFGANGDGLVTVDFAAGQDFASRVLVQADGKIVLGGRTYDAQQGTMLVDMARLNGDGSLDTSFGAAGDGRATLGFRPGDGVTSLALQADGKLLVGGSFYDGSGGTEFNFAAGRLNADGTPDAAFGGNGDGTVSVDFGGDYDVVTSVAVQA